MDEFLKNYQLFDMFSKHRQYLLMRNALTKLLRKHVGFRLPKRFIREKPSLAACLGGLQSLMYPSELAHMLVTMGQAMVGSYLEVGVSRGGTFFTVDSYLRALNPKYEISIGVGPGGKLIDLDLYPKDRYQHLNMKSYDHNPDRQFDAILIDAAHDEQSVRQDFEHYKDYATKFIFLHDIHLPRNGVEVVWNELKEKYPKAWEIKASDDEQAELVGIGVIDMRGDTDD